MSHTLKPLVRITFGHKSKEKGHDTQKTHECQSFMKNKRKQINVITIRATKQSSLLQNIQVP